MTTPRELVKQTLEFASPARIPRQLWVLPWADEHCPTQLAEIRRCFPDDITVAPGFYRQPVQVQGNPYSVGTFVDEWGCTFKNIQSGVIGEVKEPLIKTWDDLDKLRTPDALLSVDVDQVNAFCRSTDLFVTGGCCPRPFERLQFLRKSENLYVDLAEQPAELMELIHRMHEFFMKELDLWASTEVDTLNFMDDWGSQRALLISPMTWRKIFKPLYKDYIDLAHSKGKYIFMHSDGYTAEIIPDLIELGLDALNTQLFTMDIEELGRRYRGKITFWGEIDRQHLLPYASTAEIDKAVRRVKDALYQEGGVIGQCEFGAGAKPENVYQVYKSWEEVSAG
jgi:uroporphyrinogen decarboxylase